MLSWPSSPSIKSIGFILKLISNNLIDKYREFITTILKQNIKLTSIAYGCELFKEYKC